jgi:hypothetical protein
MLGDLPDGRRVTVGADKAYDTAAFVAAAREMNVTPHVTQNINEHRGSNIDARTTRHPGYRISLAIRKRIEEANGWIKDVAGMDRATFRGLPRMGGRLSSGRWLTISFVCRDCCRWDECVRRSAQASPGAIQGMKTDGISPGTSKIPDGEKNVQLGFGAFQQPALMFVVKGFKRADATRKAGHQKFISAASRRQGRDDG